MRASLLVTALCCLPTFAAAQPRDFSKVQVKVTKVAGQIYVIEDATPEFSGGNIGVSIGADGIVLIDDKFAPIAPKIQAALKTISDKPVRFILNTHFHGDHTDGNASFGPQATVIAHDNTRKRMAAGRGKEHPPAPAAALPVITFDDKLSVHLNGEDIRAVHLPSAHTDTDVVIFFTKSNVVHLGDEFFNGMFPFIDTDGGGSVKGLITNLTKLLPQLPAGAKLIPGHGPVATAKELRAFLTMLEQTTAFVEAGIKAGKTVEQLKTDKSLAKYSSWATGFFKTEEYIEMLYKDLKR
ncbi:MAG: MBL fold metallo-hydrolase [Myxococcales bacterium]|nr:MBL fold metallo-hydrolase [Myxococcales bacterium]